MKKILLQITMLALSLGIFKTTLLGADFTNSEIALNGYEKLTTVIEKNFKQTADTLMAIPDPNRQTPDWKTIRALKTKFWLQLLNQIDQARDLNFNFNDPQNGYSANVAPPHFGDSGVDPASIKDPEDRRIYEDAIRENHAKYLRDDFERELKKQDEGLTATAIQYFNSAYDKTPQDAKELVGYLDILTDSKHNAEVKEKLHEFLELAKEQNK
jgi:hypothetical protein